MTSRVTRLFQRLRHRDLLRAQCVPPLETSHPIRVPACEHACPCGRTNRCSCVETIHSQPIFCHGVKGWRLEHLMPHVAHIAPALVIGHGKNDVWPLDRQQVDRQKNEKRNEAHAASLTRRAPGKRLFAQLPPQLGRQIFALSQILWTHALCAIIPQLSGQSVGTGRCDSVPSIGPHKIRRRHVQTRQRML